MSLIWWTENEYVFNIKHEILLSCKIIKSVCTWMKIENVLQSEVNWARKTNNEKSLTQLVYLTCSAYRGQENRHALLVEREQNI